LADGFDASTGVVVMAATNRPETLDKALRRAGEKKPGRPGCPGGMVGSITFGRHEFRYKI